jgi:hypothetical protein
LQKSFIKKMFLPTGLMVCMALGASSGFSPNAPSQTQTAALARVSLLLAHDEIAEADSLFTAFDLARTMDAGDLMQWVRIKGTLAQYGLAAHVACMVLEKAPRYGAMARFQLSEILKDAAIDTVRMALSAYRACALQDIAVDTVDLRGWLARTCAAYGLFKEEVDVLASLDVKRASSARELLDCGRRRMAQGMFSQAIPAAFLAYGRLTNASEKALCALILYRSYAQTGKNDSASMWFARIPFAKETFRAEAAAFFQVAGYAVQADSLIETLPKSFTRDTLTIRRMLFAGNAKAAANEAARVFSAVGNDAGKNEAVLWRIRTMIFAGNLGAARGLLDSVDFSPSMKGADEILADKYALFALITAPSAWNDYGILAFSAWAGRSDIAYTTLISPDFDALPKGAKQLFLSLGAKTLIAGKVYSQARKVFERLVFSEFNAENRYYYADILINSGALQQGRRTLEELVLKFPADVFSAKARMALLAW